MAEKKYFPIFIDISEKKIVVIGGGTIATRRVTALTQFSGQIEVVAPSITPELLQLVDNGEITWIKEEYCPKQISEADIILAATDQPEVNHRVKDDCEKLKIETGHNILVNIADDKSLCDFYFPSIIHYDELVIGINSGGKSPGCVKETREKIQSLLEK